MSRLYRDEYGHAFYEGLFDLPGKNNVETERYGVYKSKGRAGTKLNTSDAEKQARDYWGQDFRLIEGKAVTGYIGSYKNLLYKPDIN